MADESLSQSLWHREGLDAAWGMAEFKPRPASCLQALIEVQGRHTHLEAGDGPTCQALLQVQKARISPSFIGQQPPCTTSTLHRSCDHSLDSQLEGVGVREAYLQPHALWSLLTRRTVCGQLI